MLTLYIYIYHCATAVSIYIYIYIYIHTYINKLYGMGVVYKNRKKEMQNFSVILVGKTVKKKTSFRLRRR